MRCKLKKFCRAWVSAGKLLMPSRATTLTISGSREQTAFEWALAAAECITGLIVATALVYPDKKLASVKPQSIIKRMKQKEFARSVNRDYIRECEKINIPLDEFAALSLAAMTSISDELGL